MNQFYGQIRLKHYILDNKRNPLKDYPWSPTHFLVSQTCLSRYLSCSLAMKIDNKWKLTGFLWQTRIWFVSFVSYVLCKNDDIFTLNLSPLLSHTFGQSFITTFLKQIFKVSLDDVNNGYQRQCNGSVWSCEWSDNMKDYVASRLLYAIHGQRKWNKRLTRKKKWRNYDSGKSNSDW